MENVKMFSFFMPSPACMPYLGALNPVHGEVKRHELKAYFRSSWDVDEKLFECISEADEQNWYISANPLRHPLVFYYGHSAAFYMNKMLAAGLIKPYERINPSIEAALAVGVDEMSWDSKPGEQTYPTLAEVEQYRLDVKQLVLTVLDRVQMQMPITWDSPLWALLMSMEHQRIHVETSSVLIRQLPVRCVRPQIWWPIHELTRPLPSQVPTNSLVPISGKRVTLGKTDDTYGWDNEYGHQVCDVLAFRVSQFLVSNAEFLPFVLEGGYTDARWWDDDGRCWQGYTSAVQPTFWVGRAAEPRRLKLRVMTEEVKMRWDWPVEVNHLEASAFCRWKSALLGVDVGLPSESQWYRLRETARCGDQPEWKTHALVPGNINLNGFGSPCRIDMFCQTPNDLFDVVGNVWQWTDTPIYGFEGFRTHHLYDDYSQPTFDGKHMLMKGGSWISSGHVALKSYRNAFRRHFHQHAGFRYVTVVRKASNSSDAASGTTVLDLTLAQSLHVQYGQESWALPNYTKALVDMVLEHCEEDHRGVAFDLGCATGRTTFELAHHFKRVIGTDSSGLLVNTAAQLLAGQTVSYPLIIEGDLRTLRTVSWPARKEIAATLGKISFSQNDLCNLRPQFRQPRSYDLVLANNVLDRIREPRRFLLDLTPTVKAGGLLVIACAWRWDSNFTSHEEWFCAPRAEWLKEDRRRSYAALCELLRHEFTEVTDPKELNLAIRGTERMYQYSRVQVSFWRKH